MAMIFDIPESNLNTLKKRVDRYVSRAKRHGFADIEFSVLEVLEQPVEIPDHFAKLRGDYNATRTIRKKIARVQLNDVKTMFGDWSIVGNRQTVKVNGRLESYSYGAVSDEIAKGDVFCDHCKTKRNRSLVYVVRHNDGHESQVGSTCLSDFIGSDVSAGLASGLQIHSMLAREIAEASDPYWRNGTPGEVIEESKLVLAIANRIIQDSGWTSSAAARNLGGTPTWHLVGSALELSRSKDGAGLESVAPLASDFIAADDAITWAYASEENDFMSSVRRSVERGACGGRDIAILAAAMASYRMHLARQIEVEEMKSRARTSQFVGTPGQRMEMIVSVRRMKSFMSDFGGGMIVSMTSPDGDFLTWVTSNPKGIEVGKTYEIKGTVKRHQIVQQGPFKGVNETILSRVAVGKELANNPVSGGKVEGAVSNEVYETIDEYFSSSPTL